MNAPHDVIKFIERELHWLYERFNLEPFRRERVGIEDGGWHGTEAVDDWGEFDLPQEIVLAVDHADDPPDTEESPELGPDHHLVKAVVRIDDSNEISEHALGLLEDRRFFEKANPRCLALRAVTTTTWGEDIPHLWVYVREGVMPSQEQLAPLEERYRGTASGG